LSDLSELLHTQTLKHINKNLSYYFTKTQETLNFLRFKIHHWKCTRYW